ncbi:MAG TPA: hypothetical protein VIF84_01625 [Candidatus Limnocylindrales bacterium]
MRPDDPIRLDRRRREDPAIKAALDALAAELQTAGRDARANAAEPERPLVTWAAALRDRLIAAAGTKPWQASADGLAGAKAWAMQAPDASTKPWALDAPPQASLKPWSAEALSASTKPWAVEAPTSASTKPWVLPFLARAERLSVRPMPLAGLAMAAVLVMVAVVGLAAIRSPGAPPAVAGVSVDAWLVRDGIRSSLADGIALHAGDAIDVGAAGGATLHLGDGEARLAGGASLRITALADGSVTLEQLAGRVYHRVALPEGGRYVVATGPLRWVAEGTAFDLRRSTTSGGGEQAELLAVEHAVTVRGDDLSARVAQGKLAVVTLTEGAAEALDIAPVPPELLDDPWLWANADADHQLDFELGILATRRGEPTPIPTAVGTATPGATPAEAAEAAGTPAPAAATPAPKPRATARPTAKPTAKPTQAPTSAPTAVPTPTMTLDLTACHGAVLIEWEEVKKGSFDHYLTLRNTDSSIPKAYPPKNGAVDPGTTYANDRDQLSAFDAGADAGTRTYYRAMTFDDDDEVTAWSSVKSVVPKDHADLGPLDVSGTALGLSFSWSSYGGPGKCFDYYKIVSSPDHANPSYLDGDQVLAAPGSQGDSSAAGLVHLPGTYHFIVEAIKRTDTGKFLVAHTEVETFTVLP